MICRRFEWDGANLIAFSTSSWQERQLHLFEQRGFSATKRAAVVRNRALCDIAGVELMRKLSKAMAGIR